MGYDIFSEKFIKRSTPTPISPPFPHPSYVLNVGSLREGIYYIAKKYIEANKKQMKHYDPTKPLGFIEYLDKNKWLSSLW